MKKGHAPEARLIAGIVATRVAASKEKGEKLAADAKAWKGKPPAGRDAETKVPAFGKKWAGEWRKVAKAAAKDQAKEGARLEVEAEILDALWEHARAFALFNRRRAEAGVPTVEYDFALAYGCQMHARYMERHPEAGHDEEEGKPGFSPEGHAAGQNGLLYRGASLPLGIEIQLSTVYHRAGMLDPHMRSTGFGACPAGNAANTIIDAQSALANASIEIPVVYPFENAEEVYLLVWPERPSPLSADLRWKVGYPVTVHFYVAQDQIKDCTVTLKETTKGGDLTIDCYVASPDKPATDALEHNDGTIHAIPKAPLKPATKYKVTVSYKYKEQKGTREWQFTTGSRKSPE